MSLCKLRHPFMAVVDGPTSCGKTAWVLKLVQNALQMIDPLPSRIHYCYGEYQPIFDNYRQMTDSMFDGSQPTMLIIDDLMSKTNQLVTDIFTKISHHRDISVVSSDKLPVFDHFHFRFPPSGPFQRIFNNI